MTNKEIRLNASEKCKVYTNDLLIIMLIYILITGACSALSVTGLLAIVSVIIAGPFAYALSYISKIVYEGIQPKIENLFIGFKRFSDTLVLYLLISVYTMLWSLLFVIPGIIKSISYSMAYYIMLDNPELSANDCIKKSKEIMYGHKADLFVLMLSYIGWIILCVLTCGILTLWVVPKMQTATYIFYKNIYNVPLKEEPVEEVVAE